MTAVNVLDDRTNNGERGLPYKRMLVITGVLLAMVLFVMIGEEVFEMQQANWIGTATISWLTWLPDWAGTWFSIFPDAYVIGAQIVGLVIVLGSYGFSRYQSVLFPKKNGLTSSQSQTSAPDGDASSQPSIAGHKG